MRGWGVPVGAILGMFSAALYVYVLIEIVIGDVDRNVSFVSELSARDQPHHLLFQAFDATAGALIAVLGGLVMSEDSMHHHAVKLHVPVHAHAAPTFGRIHVGRHTGVEFWRDGGGAILARLCSRNQLAIT